MCDQCKGGDFVNLHVHTEYSLLDGASRIDALVKRAADMEQDSLAITDHGVMFGAIEFYEACKKHKVKPIIGMEGYLADDTRFRRDPILDRKPYHLLMLSMNDTGYHNLMKLSSEAQLTGFYYRPRMDRELLTEYHEGLILTSGCLASDISQSIMNEDEDRARELINWYRDLLGDRFYLEVQPREHSQDQMKVNRWLLEESKRNGIKVVATTDAHYVNRADSSMHDTLLCIQTGSYKSQTNRMHFDEDTYYIMSAPEIHRFFSDRPDVMLNTKEIAERVTTNLDTKGYHIPEFAVPTGYTAETYLKELCIMGLKWRFGDSVVNDTSLMNRLDYELGVVAKMGFSTYFLIVWDICQFAQHSNIWYNIRGSAAGSLTAYTLGITSIDPLENGLYFERFLNPARISMPDIDMDFEDLRRPEVVNYVVSRYGVDRVAGIITFGTMGAKAAIKDVGRVMGYPLSLVQSISNQIPMGAQAVGLVDALTEIESIKEAYTSNPDVATFYDEAIRLEGTSRHASTHAAGIIVGNRPLNEYVPLHRVTSKNADDLKIKAVTQFPMETCEHLGLLKIDFLGLSTLTIMKRVCEMVEKRHGVKWTIDNIPYQPTGNPDLDADLENAFKMIAKGDTAGIFQIEGGGMTGMLKKMRPYKFEHIVAAIALYRPGPMQYIDTYIKRMHGDEPIVYKHPKLEKITKNTYSVIIYQEQLMQMAIELFGYAASEADNIRKAVSKKVAADLEKHHQTFIERGVPNGIPLEKIEEIWADTQEFARYSFNLAHASDYAKLTVQTAFMKAKYPVEYMAALLATYVGNNKRMGLFLDECRRMSIPLLPPDINYSSESFTIEETELETGEKVTGIRCGLSDIKRVGIAPVETIITARDNTPFEDLSDLVDRINLDKVNSGALESLIKVGAFNHFGNRVDWMNGLDKLRKFCKKMYKQRGQADSNQMTLFDTDDKPVGLNIKDFVTEINPINPTEREQLAWERELVGYYVTARPTDAYRDAFREAMTHTILDILDEDSEVENATLYARVGGEITEVKGATTKNGHKMGFVTLEDWHDTAASITAVMFPKPYEKFYDLMHYGKMVVMRGKIDRSRGTPNLLVDEVFEPKGIQTEAPIN